MKTQPVTIHTLREMKQSGTKITMVTAYDATFARLLDNSSIDALLVGDSLGMVVQGQNTTLPVTVDDIVYHTRAVVRGITRPHIVSDMPFMSYQGDPVEAIENAGRIIKQGGAHAVKLEGGANQAALIRRIVDCGIPVMGHIGLVPQSVHAMGGFKVQGTTPTGAEKLLADAHALEQAGAYAIVLEGMPQEVAQSITTTVNIPTIGIGAGPQCDGQVLVLYDLLGMDDTFKPKFVRRFENLSIRIRTAIDSYISEVRRGSFPNQQESVSLGRNTQIEDCSLPPVRSVSNAPKTNE